MREGTRALGYAAGLVSMVLRVAYDGRRFHGFARQADTGHGPVRTVQGELEAALTELFRQPVRTRGASRTDAGVHALGQLVAFEPPSEIPPRGVARALSGRLPPDLTVLAAWIEHGPDGQPIDIRQGNQGKHYRYRIRCSESRDPLAAGQQWALGRRVQPEPMQRAAQAFVGTHDFAGFRGGQCQAKTTERTIDAVAVRWWAAPLGPAGDRGRLDRASAEAVPLPDLVEVHVHGRAFLYNMVRIMVGTLVEIGLGRRAPDCIPELLARPDRQRSGMTAPAGGLTLMEVRWPIGRLFDPGGA